MIPPAEIETLFGKHKLDIVFLDCPQVRRRPHPRPRIPHQPPRPIRYLCPRHPHHADPSMKLRPSSATAWLTFSPNNAFLYLHLKFLNRSSYLSLQDFRPPHSKSLKCLARKMIRKVIPWRASSLPRPATECCEYPAARRQLLNRLHNRRRPRLKHRPASTPPENAK